jgi:hypothetical protein
MLSLHTGNVNASALAGVGLQKLNAVYGAGINVDADINFDCAGNSQISLTGNLDSQGRPVGFYVKPSEKFIMDYKFYAKNAEFYNYCDFSSDVAITQNSLPTSGTVPSIASNNLVKVWRGSYGTIKLNSKNNGKLYIDSKDVDVIGNIDGFGITPNTPKVYVKQARELNNLIAFIDHNVMTNDNFPLGSAMNYFTNYTAVKILRANHCIFNFGTNYSPWVSGWNLYGLENGEFKKCTFEFGTTPIGSSVQAWVSAWSFGSKFRECKFKGLSAIAGTSSSRYEPKFWLGDNTDVEGCEFSGLNTIIVGSIYKMSNINFNNNKATDGNAGLAFPRSSSQSLLSFNYSDSIVVENVNVKGNGADANNNAFIVETTSGSFSYPMIKGHIEVTGYYDYSNTGGTGLATETFPVKGKNITTQAQWNGNSEYIGSLCLFMHGETLKYGNLNDGVFVMMDPRILDHTPGQTIVVPDDDLTQTVVTNWISGNGGAIPGFTTQDGYSFPVFWGNNELPETLSTYLSNVILARSVPGSGDSYNVNAGQNIASTFTPRTFPNANKWMETSDNLFAWTYFNGSTNSTQLFTDMAAATGQTLSTPTTFSDTSVFPTYFAWTSDGYLIMLRQGWAKNLTRGQWINYYTINVFNPTIPNGEVNTPGTTTYSWSNNNAIPRLRMTIDAWDSDGNGYTKTICCLLCCECNINLYRIRE